jgi:hypothetical protein
VLRCRLVLGYSGGGAHAVFRGKGDLKEHVDGMYGAERERLSFEVHMVRGGAVVKPNVCAR